MNVSHGSLVRYAKHFAQLKKTKCEKYFPSDGVSVASKVEICAILKWSMRKLEICGSFKFAHAILKLCIAFKPLFSHSYL